MNLLNRLRTQAFWINAPTMLVIMLLQRTPVVRVLAMAEQIFSSSTVSAVLRGGVVASTAVAVHTLAGATQLSASSPSPLAAQVGTPVSVAFAITGTLSEPERWFITGSVPPGLTIDGATSGTVLGGIVTLSGTPTTVGNYVIGLQAKDDPTGNLTPVYNYAVNVTNPAPTAPSITTQPQGKSAFVGDNVTFTGAASGSPAPTFKWQKDGVDIGGATSATLTLNNVQLGDAAVYTLVATNSAGSATSNGAMLTVDRPPEAPLITLQPLDASAVVGDDVMFEIAASGNPAPTFQWKKDGVDLSGETGTTLLLTGVQTGDAGTYTAVATNASGSVTSNAAVLDVAPAPFAPTVTTQPKNFSVLTGGRVTFMVAADGFPLPTFQWQVSTDGGTNWSNVADSSSVSGSATDSLTLDNVQLNVSGNRYRATATNTGASVTSNAGALTVSNPTGPRLINLSTRAFAGQGASTLIVGFFINGTGEKTVVIRGIGPRLGEFGVPNVVVDPLIRVFDSGGTIIAENDDWTSDRASHTGGFSLTPGSKDAALELTLAPGLYSIHLVNTGPVAEGLIEVYDTSKDVGSRLTNLSSRININTGQIVTIGTVMEGGTVGVLARNLGPGLAQYLPDPDKASVIPDPVLRFFNSSSTLLTENNDWDVSLAPRFGAVGAFPITEGSTDAADRIVISAGGYTVQASGNGPGGVALVELYESP